MLFNWSSALDYACTVHIGLFINSFIAVSTIDVRELEHQITALTRELDISKTRENTLEKVVQGKGNLVAV